MHRTYRPKIIRYIYIFNTQWTYIVQHAGTEIYNPNMSQTWKTLIYFNKRLMILPVLIFQLYTTVRIDANQVQYNFLFAIWENLSQLYILISYSSNIQVHLPEPELPFLHLNMQLRMPQTGKYTLYSRNVKTSRSKVKWKVKEDTWYYSCYYAAMPNYQ